MRDEGKLGDRYSPSRMSKLSWSPSCRAGRFSVKRNRGYEYKSAVLATPNLFRDSSRLLEGFQQIQSSSTPDIDSFGIQPASPALAAHERLHLPIPIPHHRQSFKKTVFRSYYSASARYSPCSSSRASASLLTHHQPLSRVAAFGCRPLTPQTS